MTNLKPRKFIALLAVVFLGFLPSLSANPAKKNLVIPSLAIQASSVAPGTTTWVAVKLKMAKGWHTYWKNPGDSGLATKIKWQLPEGVTAGAIEWPAPEKFIASKITSYGYSGEVYLLVPIEVSKTVKLNQKVKLSAQINWVACEEICVWGKGNVEGEIKIDAVTLQNEKEKDLFARAFEKLPLRKSNWQVRASRQAESLFLEVVPTPGSEAKVFTKLEFFPDDNRLIKHAAEQVLKPMVDGSYQLVLKLAPSSKKIQFVKGVLVASDMWDGQRSSKALWIEALIKEIK